MNTAVCKVTVHKRGGVANLPYILREDAAKEPTGQAIGGRERDGVSEFTQQGQANERALENTQQLELSFSLELPLLEDEELTLDDDPIFTWNVPDFVTGDPYGKEWLEEERASEGKRDQGKERFRGEEIGAGKQKENKLTLEEKRQNAETYFSLRADYEESKGGISHYRVVVTLNRIISNRQFKRLILPFLSIIYGFNEAVISLHRNTGERKTHAHIHVNSRQLDGRRIDLGQLYFKLDEIWAKTCAEHLREPDIYKRHMTKKEETRKWKEATKIAKARGEIPPLKPDREADHHGTKYERPFNNRWVGRQIAKENLAQKKLEFLIVSKASKKEINAARKEAQLQRELVDWALEKRKEGKKGLRGLPPTVGTVKEGKEFGTYERAIKAIYTREMAGHISKVSNDYLKSLGEKALVEVVNKPEAAKAHAAKILELRLKALKEHKVEINRTEWSQSSLKADALERLNEFSREAVAKLEKDRILAAGAPSAVALLKERDSPTGEKSFEGIASDARAIRKRMILAEANELLEKHILEKCFKGQRLASLQKGDQKFQNQIFDLRKIVFEHCLQKHSSLEELKLTEKDLTDTLEKYVLSFHKGYVPPPFNEGERVQQVKLDEKKHKLTIPLTLAHGLSNTSELTESVIREQTPDGKTGVSEGALLSDLETARLHGRATLAGLRLDASKAEAERYKFYSLFEEEVVVPDRYGTQVEWSLAQGKYFGAAVKNLLRERHWEVAPRVSEAVSLAEKRIEEGLKVRDTLVREAGNNFEQLKRELIEVVKVRATHGLKTPQPNFTQEQSQEVEQLLFMTWNTDALAKLSCGDESHDLRGAAQRASARSTLALLYQGEDRVRQRVGDQKIVESMKILPTEHPFRVDMQAYLNFRQEESARIEKFVQVAGQIAEHLQLKCEVELGERAAILFRAKEAELVKEKLPSLEQKKREKLTKELNKESFVQSPEGGIESARFSDFSPTDYSKHQEYDLARNFETARMH